MGFGDARSGDSTSAKGQFDGGATMQIITAARIVTDSRLTAISKAGFNLCLAGPLLER